MSLKPLLAFWILVAGLAGDAKGSVFTAERQTDLCGEEGDRVAPGALAEALVGEACAACLDLKPDLNGDGKRDEEDWVYALAHWDALPDGHLKAVLEPALDGFGEFLLKGGNDEEGYVVQAPPGAKPLPSSFLEEAPGFHIACVDPPGLDALTRMVRTKRRGATVELFSKRFRLRRTLAAFTEPDLGDAEPAQIAFRQDDTADSDTFQVDLAAGWYLFDLKETWKVTPYVKYERTRTNAAGREDVEVLSPGFLLEAQCDWGPEGRSCKRKEEAEEAPKETAEEAGLDDKLRATAKLGIALEAPFDREQESERVRVSGYFAPGFARGDSVWLGVYRSIGPLWHRLDLRIVAEAAHVFDAGASDDLSDHDVYTGVGGEIELRLRLPIEPLSRFVLSAGYRHLEVFSAKIDQVQRFKAGLEFALEDRENFILKVSYEDGENAKTFQSERFWGVSAGVRF